MKRNYKRKKKLIKPALQLKLISVFLGTAAIAVLVQAIMMSRSLTAVPELSNAEHEALLTHLPGILITNVAITLAMLIPLILLIGITVTHRVVGPIYRFEMYLGQLARGERLGPCHIRKNDELHELCRIINQATESMHQPLPESEQEQEDSRQVAA